MNTRYLNGFGWRELDLATDILNAMKEDGLPDNFEDDEVQLEFNPNSGNVFLVNAEFQSAMMNGDTLEIFYQCGNCGAEGFEGEFVDDDGAPHVFDSGYVTCEVDNED